MTSSSHVCNCTALDGDALLGRLPVGADFDEAARRRLTGRRILVTGAGGSIGAELCAQIARYAPGEIIAVDRDESALQQTQLAISGNGLLNSREVVLADIRDEDSIVDVFTDRRPEVVFHAAALKHLPMLEQYPQEAWKTNVLGTRNVLRAAERSGVETFVNISTDKAANPTSVLGMSKRLAERLTAASGARTGNPYSSVRFGNVLGSRGSMLPLFRSLIRNGGPVTVTDPEATRYFMSIAEACQLVLQASVYDRPGEVLVLDMGSPVRILDVANRLIAESGRDDIEIVFTGLRDGEKLHEELTGLDEIVRRPFHPRIAHALVPPISEVDLESSWKSMREATAPISEAAAA